MTWAMREEHRNRIEGWLELGAPESSGPELETAWSGLLAMLPEEAPSDAFADRVLRRVAESRRASRDLPARWRFVLAAALTLCGISALFVPAVLLAIPIPIGGLIAAVADVVKAGAVWVAQGLSLWRILHEIAQTASLIVATPEATAFLAGFAVLSAAALRLLHDLTLYDRSSAGAASR